MFLFIRLLLGHFIGDFPLQFNKVFELKHKGLSGGIPHALLIVLSLLVLSWPYLAMPGIWVFIFFVGLLHLFQDSVKISYGKLKYSFWLYILDQLFHAGTIAMVFFTSLSNVQPPPDNGSLLVSYYKNDLFIIYCIALIIVTYNGLFMIKSFRVTFFGRARADTSFEKWYGMFERATVVSLAYWGKYFLLAIPVIFLMRPLVYYAYKKKVFIRKRFLLPQEMVLSWVIAALSGIGLLLIKQKFY